MRDLASSNQRQVEVNLRYYPVILLRMAKIVSSVNLKIACEVAAEILYKAFIVH